MAMSNEQLRELINVLTQGRVNTFAQCNARYNGIRHQDRVEEFLLQATIFKTAQNINDETALVGFPLLLEGEAATWWQGVQRQAQTWDGACDMLRQQFAPPKPAYQLYLEIFQDKQKLNEPTDKFVARKRALLSKITAPLHIEATQIDMVYGLLSHPIRAAVARSSVNTFAELIRSARQTEELMMVDSTNNQKRERCDYCKKSGHTQQVCRSKKRHDEERDQKKPAAFSSKYKEEKPEVKCYGCGAPGVYRANCQKCKQTVKPMPPDAEFYSLNLQIGVNIPTVEVCINGYKGVAHIDTGARTSIASNMLYQHLKHRGCKFNELNASITVADGTIRENVGVLTTDTSIFMGNRNNEISLLVLPYAENNRTLLGIDFLESAGIIPNPPQRTWSYIDKPNTHYQCNITTGQHVIQQPVVSLTQHIIPSRKRQISDGLQMSGITRLSNKKSLLTSHIPPTSQLKQREQPINTEPLPKPNIEAIMTQFKRQPIISPLAKTPIERYILVNPLPKPNIEAIMTQFQIQPIISPIPKTPIERDTLATALCTPAAVTNTEPRTPNSKELAAIFAKYDSPKECSKIENRWQQLHLVTPENLKNKKQRLLSEAEMKELIEKYEEFNWDSPSTMFFGMINIELRPDEAINLTFKEKQLINSLLTQHSDVFKKNGPPTTILEHRIITQEDHPIATPPYRLPALKRQQLQIELEEMLQDNIIEESDSPFSSPVVMVPKKDGSTRICVDYRKLNSITVPDQYPLPRIDDMLHEARSTAFMSTIDLRSGYWQISVRQCDREKTAFTTPFGLYEFTRMPFGLRNAPATFQRLMNIFRNGLPKILLLAYLDDLIIISENLQQHIHDLESVFKRLQQFNLRASREKCHFACHKVKYLGHILTKEGIQMDPDKISAIINRRPPDNVKQVMSFIQTCSWYRRFVANFAEIMQPLTQLTRKNSTWTWGPNQQKVFDDMKMLLTTAPILSQANETLPFIIKTDASGYALGAVLVQGEKETEHPIEYASRLLTSAERNYSTIEREALAVVWAIDRFRGYIDGAEVNIVTDHQPLKWLMTIKSPTGRLARWALRLQPYDIKINYTPGRTNVIADGLSRPPVDEPNGKTCEIGTIQIDLPTRGAEEIRNEQMEDEDLKEIILSFESSSKNETFQRWTSRGYLLNNGVLYRYSPLAETLTEDAQLVVAKHKVPHVLEQYHDLPTSGHYGIQRTLARLTSRFYWSGMRKDITNYVNKCIECQRYKATNLKPAGLIQSLACNQRFEIIAIDLFGPLPKSEEGYRHIFIIEDLASRWIELFALTEATAGRCATILIEEIFLRYGVPRRILSDNGTQFVTAVMQKLTFCLQIKHIFTPVYHPEANPVERKNRDMKPQLAILVGDHHTKWPEHLPAIRFAMNTARCASTGYSAAYLTFGRELRTPHDVEHDLRTIVQSENFVPEITPYLLKMADTLENCKENVEQIQDRNRKYTDARRRPDPGYQPGDKVLVKTHILSNATKQLSAKLSPRRDGPYVILQRKGAASYEVAALDTPTIVAGIFHSSALSLFRGDAEVPIAPVNPIRKRGRPRKQPNNTNQ